LYLPVRAHDHETIIDSGKQHQRRRNIQVAIDVASMKVRHWLQAAFVVDVAS
jgi:hypothetical protein